MDIVFFGTPNYVISVLEAIHKTFKSRAGESPIVAVVTQSPKPTGRKQMLEYSPVDTWAHKKGVPIFFDSMDLIKKGVYADLGVLASYGAIIPKAVINYFAHGILNIHPSLLPKLRGTSPIQAAIVVGAKEAGVTIIKIDEKLDHGPIVSQFKEDVLPDDTTGSLRKRLFERSAEVLVALIPAYISGKITPREQDHSKATFTRLIKKEDGFILPRFMSACLQGVSLRTRWQIPFMKDYSLIPNTYSLERFIRAMDPWPGAWTEIKLQRDKITKPLRLKILKAHIEGNSEPTTQDPQLVLDEVQLEGKNPVSWKQFKEAYATATFE